MAGRYSIEATFRLIDEVTKPLEKIGDAGGAFGDIFKNDMMSAENRVNSFAQSLGKIALVGTIAAGLGVATQQFIEFDDSLHKAGALFVDLDPQAEDFTDRLKGIGTAARDVAAITEFNAQQAADALATMAMAGFKTDQALALLPRTADLATAAGLDLSTAVGMAADTLGVFNLMSEDTNVLESNFKRISDIMVRTAGLANQDISQVFGAMSLGGAFFNKGNQGIEDIGAMIDALASRNLKGSEAGTAIRNVMLRLSAPNSDPARDAMKQLGLMHWEGTGEFIEKGRGKGQEIGSWVSDILDQQGNLINIIDIIDKLNVGIQGMGGAEIDANLNTVFGEGAIIAIKNLMDVGGDALRSYAFDLQNASNDMGATAQAAEVMRSSMSSKINFLKSGLTELGFKFVDAFQDKGVYILEKITDAINDFDPTPLITFAVLVADRMMFLVDVLWNLRYIILGVIGAIAVYQTIMTAFVVVTNAVRIAQMLATAASYAYNIVILKNTAAIAFLKAETLATRAATAIFSATMWIGQGAMTAFTFITTGLSKVFQLLKLDIIAATIATNAQALATKAATIAQAVFNVVLSMNPIGLVIIAIAVLIGIIILLVKYWDAITEAVRNNSEKLLFFISIFLGPFGFILSMIQELIFNWEQVTAAFEEGGILGAIKRIGGILLSGLLIPVQGLLEILSLIPGIGIFAGKGADKIEEIRNSLKGLDTDTTVEVSKTEKEDRNIKIPSMEDLMQGLPNIQLPGTPTSAIVAPSMEDLMQGIPNIQLPDTYTSDMLSPSMENLMPNMQLPDTTKAPPDSTGSKLHGIYDINGAVPSLSASVKSDSTGSLVPSTEKISSISDTTLNQAMVNLLTNIDVSVMDIAQRISGVTPEIPVAPDTMTAISDTTLNQAMVNLLTNIDVSVTDIAQRISGVTPEIPGTPDTMTAISDTTLNQAMVNLLTNIDVSVLDIAQRISGVTPEIPVAPDTMTAISDTTLNQAMVNLLTNIDVSVLDIAQRISGVTPEIPGTPDTMTAISDTTLNQAMVNLLTNIDVSVTDIAQRISGVTPEIPVVPDTNPADSAILNSVTQVSNYPVSFTENSSVVSISPDVLTDILTDIALVTPHIDSSIETIMRSMSISQEYNNKDDEYDRDSSPISPVTQAERMAYSLEERREVEVVEIQLSIPKGVEARVIRAPHSIDVQLIHSGGNDE